MYSVQPKLLTLWKGHTVGTNRSIDQQEVAFQNNCTWLMLPKYTQSGVYLTYQIFIQAHQMSFYSGEESDSNF